MGDENTRGGVRRFVSQLRQLSKNPRATVSLTARGYGYALGASIVVLLVSLAHVWLGPNDWAGLGQWVGGLGAFYAALVALRISGREARDRAEADAHQGFVRANLVIIYDQNGAIVISNRCREAITDVWLTGYYLDEHWQPLKSGKIDLLLPAIEPYTHQFEVKPGHGMSQDEVCGLLDMGAQFEFEFTDLRGNRWARRWRRVVRPVPKSARPSDGPTP